MLLCCGKKFYKRSEQKLIVLQHCLVSGECYSKTVVNVTFAYTSVCVVWAPLHTSGALVQISVVRDNFRIKPMSEALIKYLIMHE